MGKLEVVEENGMKNAIYSVIIMTLASFFGMIFGSLANNEMGGMILFALIAGIACIIYTLDNKCNK